MGLIIGLLIFSSISFAEVDKWTKKADMPTGRGFLSTSVVNGKIYAIGGMKNENNVGVALRTVEAYDPALDKWTTKTDMPTARCYMIACAVNGKIYVIGGMTSVAAACSMVEVYDPVSDKWTKRDGMPIARFCLAGAVVKGRIYAIGGATDRVLQGNNVLEICTLAVEEYDPISNKWTEKADMPTARFGFAAVEVNSKIYCIGGRDNDNIFSIVEEYDPTLDKWTKKADMPTPRCFFSVSAVNSKIFAFGGGNRNGKVLTTEEYDPREDKWTKKTDMTTEQYGLSSNSVNGKIYAIGGYNSGYLSTVEEYDTGFTGESVKSQCKLAATWGEIKK